MKNSKIAVVVKGYAKSQNNKVFGIYVLDTKSLYLLPRPSGNSDDICTEEESFDLLGDVIGMKFSDYHIQYDMKEEKQFDLTQYHPTIE